MSKVISFLTITVLVFVFFGCASSAEPTANAKTNANADEAAAAAMAALNAMDTGAYTDIPGSSSNGASSPAASSGGGPQPSASAGVPGSKPAWVDSPDSVYSKQRYVAAVGFGSDRRQAERSALANLTGVFGQAIQSEMKTVSSYSEAVKNGTIQMSENTTVQNAISTSAGMDSLVGAEIADVWFDSKSTYYAAAIMEKSKTAVLYADIIRSNERVITNLTTMTSAERNTLNGYSRYLLSATIADANRVYANVLTYVGNTTNINPAEMKKGEEYRLAAADVARSIPIGVSIEGDKSDRIKNAFSRALSGLGFRSGGTNSRYVLKGNLTMTPADFPNQQNKFIRYNVDADLTDTAEGDAVLLPYNANGREGHLNIAEAEERSYRAAEKKIGDEFGTSLQAYLSTLLPGGK